MNTMLITRTLDARDLKARVDLSAIAGQFTRLRRSGRQFVGLCPLHSERHASFYVHPGKQVFKCFGCGAGGDVFTFVMRATGCDFRCALEIVSDFFEGVASEGPRGFCAARSEQGGEAPSARNAGTLYSQSTQEPRARIVAALDATDRRLNAIEAVNREASAAMLSTACEPQRMG